MRILDAVTMRDGGTTCITIEENGQVKHVTFDYELGMAGNNPHVYVSNNQFSRRADGKLEIDSAEEQHLILGIRQLAVQEYGEAFVRDYLRAPKENPKDEMWFYVFNFLRIASVERGLR